MDSNRTNQAGTETAEPGSGLPTELDRCLKRILNSAFSQCGRRGLSVDYLASGLADPAHSWSDLDGVLLPLREPASYYAAETHACAWALGQAELAPVESAVVVRVLCELVSKRARYDPGTRWSDGTLMPALGLLGLLALVLLVLAQTRFEDATDMFIFAHGAVAVPVAALALLRLRARENDAQALRIVTIHTLGRIGAVEAVGTLAGAACDGDARVAGMAGHSLRLLLPALTAAHYGTLAADTTPNLCRLLLGRESLEPAGSGGRREYGFRLALLDAIEKVGDPRAEPSVSEAAAGWPERAVANGVEVCPREAAQRVLTTLAERRRLQNAQFTLLRPAAKSDTEPTELLRVSEERSGSRPEELLRSASTEPLLPNL